MSSSVYPWNTILSNLTSVCTNSSVYSPTLFFIILTFYSTDCRAIFRMYISFRMYCYVLHRTISIVNCPLKNVLPSSTAHITMYGSKTTIAVIQGILDFWLLTSFMVKKKDSLNDKCNLGIMILNYTGFNLSKILDVRRKMFTCLIKVLTNVDSLNVRFEMYNTLKSINAIGWIANPISDHV